MKLREAVGRNVRVLREGCGLSRERLAALTMDGDHEPLSAKTIERVEKAETEAGIETLARIASALNVSLPELFKGVDSGGARNRAGE